MPRRRRLAAQAKKIGLDRLHELATVVTPRTLLNWHQRLATREVQIAGLIPEPHERWMKQVARNLTDGLDGFLRGCRHLIHDRTPLFSEGFRRVIEAAGIESVRLPPRSPNLNAIAERFVRSIKESCLDRVILIGESSLHRATAQFVLHHHHERNHQGLGNKLIRPQFAGFTPEGAIRCRERLGGLLRSHYREAACGCRCSSFRTLRLRGSVQQAVYPSCRPDALLQLRPLLQAGTTDTLLYA